MGKVAGGLRRDMSFLLGFFSGGWEGWSRGTFTG